MEGLYEEDATAGREAGADKVPELGEALWWHVGQPEGEEHNIVKGIRMPGEDVGLKVADRGLTNPLTCDGQHLRGGVYGRRVAGELD